MKLSTLENVFFALNQAGVQYLVAGGIAVNAYGYQRLTADLDMVIHLTPDNIQKAMHALSQLDYTPIIPVSTDDFSNAETRKNWIKTKNMQVLSLQSSIHQETTIDIFVTEPFDFTAEYTTAPLAELTPEISFRLVSIPTLINMKKGTGRAKDVDDIEHLQLILDSRDETQN